MVFHEFTVSRFWNDIKDHLKKVNKCFEIDYMDVFSFNKLDVRPGAEERADSTPTDATPSSAFSRIEAREIRNEDMEIVRDDTYNFV